MKQYYKWVNTARGIGMILVVSGHAISDMMINNGNSLWRVLFNFIYSFHMPLFFFLAGYIGVKALGLHSIQDKKIYIFKRFKRLMVPYFFVGIIYIPLKIAFLPVVNVRVKEKDLVIDFIVGNNPDFQLWTLYTLFLCALFVCFFNIAAVEILLIVTLILKIVDFIIPSTIIIIHNFMAQSLFYMIGIAINLVMGDYTKYRKHKNFVMISAFSILLLMNMLFYIYSIDILKLISAVAGITAVCELCKIIEKFDLRILDVIGNYSMDIYIMANLVQVMIRNFFFYRFHVPGGICCVLSITLGIFIPIVVSKYILRRFRLTKMLIIGEFRG